ncbi:MAG: hypothetical protein U0L57_03995, partial [Bacteroidales bacterium]|nr:hypothetical protein [Bacteroidales bacterium]
HGQKAEKPTKTTVKCSANNATAEKAISKEKETRNKKTTTSWILRQNVGHLVIVFLLLQRYNKF